MSNKFNIFCAGLALVATGVVGCTTDPDPSVPQGSLSSAACAAKGNEVLLLVDTSLRMGEPSGYKQGSNFLTREQLVVDALKRTLPHVKKEVDFGLLTFPFVDHRDGNPTLCPGSCDVSDIYVEPGSPYGWIVSRLEHVEIGGRAAVARAINKAKTYFEGHAANGRTRSVILFTGGADTCSGDALNAIAALKAIGVPTIVVSFANSPDQDMLNLMAFAGGKDFPVSIATPKFLTPDSGFDLLADAFETAGAFEICDGLDNDCDGLTDEGFDSDGDGWSTCMDDCNDHNPFVYPGASETDHVAPYAAARVVTFYQAPTRGGGFVSAASSNPAEALDYDATDSDSVFFSLGFDGFIEVEFDCPVKNGAGADLRVWEKTYAGNTAYATETADVYAFDPIGKSWVKLGQASNLPVAARPNVANDFDLGALPFANRIRIVNTTPAAGVESTNDGFDVNGIQALHPCGACDGIDNDCNGATDEGYNLGAACSVTVGLACSASGTWVCEATTRLGLCNVTDGPRIGAETCNDADDDCDGQVDEGLTQACQTACGTGHRSCADGAWGSCTVDHPNPELCNGLDDDCDGQVDEGFDVGSVCTVGVNACSVSGYMVCSGDGLETVCDASGDIEASPERCNGLDDDCDGQIDEGKGLCPIGQICYKGHCVYD